MSKLHESKFCGIYSETAFVVYELRSWNLQEKKGFGEAKEK